MGDSPSILSDGRSEVMVQADSTTELVDIHPDDRPHPVSRLLRVLADWGMEETEACTLGELIQEIMVSQATNPAWDEITSIPLSELATPCPSALEVLEEWTRGLTEIEQSIFWNRMAPRNRMKTLQELAWDHQMPYTTTWETEKNLYAKLLEFMETDEGAPMKRRVQVIGKRLGVAQREQDADTIPDLDPDTAPHRDLLLRLAGPYRRQGEWLVLESTIPTDPTEELVRRADQDGMLDEQLASASLEQWGLAPERHRDWITRDGRVKGLRRNLTPGRQQQPVRPGGARPGRPGTPGDGPRYTRTPWRGRLHQEHPRRPLQGRPADEHRPQTLGTTLLEPATVRGHGPSHAGDTGEKGRDAGGRTHRRAVQDLPGQARDHKGGSLLPPVRGQRRDDQDETQGRPHTQEGPGRSQSWRGRFTKIR